MGVSWGTRWRKQADSRISGTGGTGSVGRNWLTTTAFGMTCTIEGLRAPRRTVFSLLQKSGSQSVCEGSTRPGTGSVATDPV